jgi:hypothetical protein
LENKPQCTSTPDVGDVLFSARFSATAVNAQEWEEYCFMRATTAELATHDKPRIRAWRLALWLLPFAVSVVDCAHAQQPAIHRCIGADGEPTFSDKECGRSMPAPAVDAAAGVHELPQYGTSVPLTQTCPVSAEDLLRRARATFNPEQAVAFSGLILWDGMGRGSSIAALRELAVLVSEPLLSMELDYDSWGNLPQSRQPRFARESPPALSLVVRTVSEHDNQVPYESVVRFDVTDANGCWWLLIPW